MFNQILKFFGSQPKSKTVAKNRLQLILIQDRLGLEASKLDNLRADLISILSKYFEIDNSKVKIKLLKEEEKFAFVANAPILNSKQRFGSPL